MTPVPDEFSASESTDRDQTSPHETTRLHALINSAHPDVPEDGVPDTSVSRRLRISTPEEMLAYIQCTLGFQPDDSLVIVAFAGCQLSTVIRCDLPDPLQKMLRSDTLESITFLDFGLTEPQELQLMEIGKHLGQLMAREPSTTGCLLLYLPGEVTVSNQHALAATGTANAMITAQFGIQEIPIEESWLIHHHQLWHLRCAITTHCEVQGQSLGDAETTDLFHSLDPQGKTRQRSQQADRRLALPPISTGTSQNLAETQTLLEQRPQLVLTWLQRWNERLGSGPTMLHSDQVQELLSAVEHSTLREAVLGIACFDLTTTLQGMVSLGWFPQQMADLAGLQNSPADGRAVKGCMRGRSERNPNWQRIAALERLCRQLLPLADNRSGGGVAGLLVWIEWVRGRGSIALDYLRQARQRFPSDRYLISLENLLQQGSVAEWATRTDSAWTPRHAA